MARKLPFPKPATSGQYAADLDVELGAPMPLSPATLAVTSAWVQSESPTFPGWNGLGTELYLKGAKPDPSNNRVFDYPNLKTGLLAAVDMMEGKGPQTTPDAPQFVADVRSGKATSSQLVADVKASHWAGLSIPDTYDSSAITAKLASSNFAVSGAAASPPATTASFGLNPLQWPSQAAQMATGGIVGTIKTMVLKGALTLMGAGMIFYGLTLLTDKKSPVAGGSPASLAADPEALAPEALAAA